MSQYVTKLTMLTLSQQQYDYDIYPVVIRLYGEYRIMLCVARGKSTVWPSLTRSLPRFRQSQTCRDVKSQARLSRTTPSSNMEKKGSVLTDKDISPAIALLSLNPSIDRLLFFGTRRHGYSQFLGENFRAKAPHDAMVSLLGKIRHGGDRRLPRC